MIKTTSEKKADRERTDNKLKETIEERRKIFNAVAATADGKEVFKYLMDILGWKKKLVIMDPNTGEVNRDATVYLEARRSAYVDIRKHIDSIYLKLIEFD